MKKVGAKMKSENSKNRAHERERGAVTMEMVIICVLIAAACLVGVIVIGRAIFRNTDLMDKAVTGQGERAANAISCPNEGYRRQAEDDIKEAEKFPREFSDTKQ